jgi:BlaI family penicillinase repressor
MRKRMPKIAESEWRVMQVLWEHGPLTANQMVHRLAGEVKWKPRTIKTLIGRLVKKDADLSPEEIKELQQILEQKGKG